MLSTNDQYVEGKFTWFTGKVEDVNDPLFLNRVKVRCYGYHSLDTGLVSTNDLPFATVMMPCTSASIKGVGGNHHLEVGSWVMGFFRDGPSAQDPVVMGSIATKEDDVIDIPTEAQLNPPTNKVYKSNAGHLIEIDNTSGAERINVKHKSGTTILINASGDIEVNSISDVVKIDGNTTITGTLTVSDATNLQSTLDVTGAQTNSSTITASGEITSGTIELTNHVHSGIQSGTSKTGKPE